MEQGSGPGSTHDLLRLGITLSAIAIALASFQVQSIVTPFFLLAGLAAALGTAYAMVQLWVDSNLKLEHLLPRHRPEWFDGRYEALVYITWGMIALVVTYLVMLFITFYAQRSD
jgi:hypothetical protein